MPPFVASYFTLAGDILPSAGSPSPLSLQERAVAARRAGFRGLGLFHVDLLHLVERHGFAEIRNILTDAGIDILELEVLKDWIANGAPPSQSPGTRAKLLEAAAELGAMHVKATGDIGASWPLDMMAEGFAGLCDEAAAAGTRIAIEFTAFSGIPTAAAALQILEAADRPNGGLFVDIWHVRRSGMSDADVAAIPAGRIFGVEISDGAAAPQGSLLEDSIYRRLFCGEGEFDVPAFLRAIRSTGYAGAIGVELLSDRIRAMPVNEVAERAIRSSLAQFD